MCCRAHEASSNRLYEAANVPAHLPHGVPHVRQRGGVVADAGVLAAQVGRPRQAQPPLRLLRWPRVCSGRRDCGRLGAGSRCRFTALLACRHPARQSTAFRLQMTLLPARGCPRGRRWPQRWTGGVHAGGPGARVLGEKRLRSAEPESCNLACVLAAPPPRAPATLAAHSTAAVQIVRRALPSIATN